MCIIDALLSLGYIEIYGSKQILLSKTTYKRTDRVMLVGNVELTCLYLCAMYVILSSRFVLTNAQPLVTFDLTLTSGRFIFFFHLKQERKIT